MKNLTSLRKQIEKLDTAIIKTLKKRFEVTEKIAKVKIEAGWKKIVDKKREDQLQEMYEKASEAVGISKQFIEKLFNLIMKESRKTQKEKTKSKAATRKGSKQLKIDENSKK
jgi:chorismate mutase